MIFLIYYHNIFNYQNLLIVLLVHQMENIFVLEMEDINMIYLVIIHQGLYFIQLLTMMDLLIIDHIIKIHILVIILKLG